MTLLEQMRYTQADYEFVTATAGVERTFCAWVMCHQTLRQFIEENHIENTDTPKISEAITVSEWQALGMPEHVKSINIMGNPVLTEEDLPVGVVRYLPKHLIVAVK